MIPIVSSSFSILDSSSMMIIRTWLRRLNRQDIVWISSSQVRTPHVSSSCRSAFVRSTTSTSVFKICSVVHPFLFTLIEIIVRFEIICIDLVIFHVNHPKKLRELFCLLYSRNSPIGRLSSRVPLCPRTLWHHVRCTLLRETQCRSYSTHYLWNLTFNTKYLWRIFLILDFYSDSVIMISELMISDASWYTRHTRKKK